MTTSDSRRATMIEAHAAYLREGGLDSDCLPILREVAAAKGKLGYFDVSRPAILAHLVARGLVQKDRDITFPYDPPFYAVSALGRDVLAKLDGEKGLAVTPRDHESLASADGATVGTTEPQDAQNRVLEPFQGRAVARPLLRRECRRADCKRIASREVVIERAPLTTIYVGDYCVPCAGEEVRRLNRAKPDTRVDSQAGQP